MSNTPRTIASVLAPLLGLALAIVPLRAENPSATALPPATAPIAAPSGHAVQPPEERIVLSPAPSASPRINGPTIYGARPGHPFLYRIPCTGERAMKFAADGLPSGLGLNADTGIITGTVPARGNYAIVFHATNARGQAERPFKLVAGDTLALTPPMGYNHWYTHFNRITQKLMEEAADVVVASGMADAGYQYINVDDCWMNAASLSTYQTDPKRVNVCRDAQGNILPNVHFPDMKGMADYIHAKGLKAGIYTSPGPVTCAGFTGAYQHEEQDARQFAAWGYDFVKYDWCSYGHVAGKKPDLAAIQKPYRLMGDLLKQQPRDIVFNLCQYGMGAVWKWGAEVGGHSWRTAGDLGFELHNIFGIALENIAHREYNRPGQWNDPDYLQIGWVGAQRNGAFETAHPCPLTPNEQYSFMSLWCMLACPLVYSGDMSRLDDFTLRILCNPELIDINQDSLGQCARVQTRNPDGFFLVKDLEDGGKAVALCNQMNKPQRMSVKWTDAGLPKPARVLDCWRMVDLKNAAEDCEIEVPARFTEILRLYPAKDATPQDALDGTPMTDSDRHIHFDIVEQSTGSPLIVKGQPGTEGNKYGFEGGRMVKISGTYHWITTEMVGDPKWVVTKLAYWTSTDGKQWTRVRTLAEGTGDFTGKDERSSVWGPQMIFNETDNRWEMFYVLYRGRPNEHGMFYSNYDGRIMRSVSTVPGMEGVGGPYKDSGVIMSMQDKKVAVAPWEGLQGVDAFFPYKVGGQWYAFHNTGAHDKTTPTCKPWRLGIARSESNTLDGPWKRLWVNTPVPFDPNAGQENAIVDRLKSGRYIVMFDVVGGSDDVLGYAVSDDGLHWSKVTYLYPDIQKNEWFHEICTPLGLIDEGDGIFSVFYTVRGRHGWDSLASLTLKLTEK